MFPFLRWFFVFSSSFLATNSKKLNPIRNLFMFIRLVFSPIRSFIYSFWFLSTWSTTSTKSIKSSVWLLSTLSYFSVSSSSFSLWSDFIMSTGMDKSCKYKFKNREKRKKENINWKKKEFWKEKWKPFNKKPNKDSMKS